MSFYSPLEQFEIYMVNIDLYLFIYFKILYFAIYGSDPTITLIIDEAQFTKDMYLLHSFHSFVLTNTTIYMMMGFISFCFFIYLSSYSRELFPKNAWDYFSEKIFLIFKDIVEQNFEARFWAQAFFPFLYTIFFFILFSNLMGLVPYGFTTTSFIVETFTLSASMLIGLTILAIAVQGNDFFAHFVPKGIPVALIPMLVVIEIISYVSKAFSLAIRLFANLMSGHTLLNILSSFAIQLGNIYIVVGLIPFIVVVAIGFLEVGIALLQAYVFMILLTLYFNDTCKVDHDFYDNNRLIYDVKWLENYATRHLRDKQPIFTYRKNITHRMRIDYDWKAFTNCITLPISNSLKSRGGLVNNNRLNHTTFFHSDDWVDWDDDPCEFPSFFNTEIGRLIHYDFFVFHMQFEYVWRRRQY